MCSIQKNVIPGIGQFQEFKKKREGEEQGLWENNKGSASITYLCMGTWVFNSRFKMFIILTQWQQIF